MRDLIDQKDMHASELDYRQISREGWESHPREVDRRLAALKESTGARRCAIARNSLKRLNSIQAGTDNELARWQEVRELAEVALVAERLIGHERNTL